MRNKEESNNGISIEYLKKPKEFSANPLIPVIEGLMSNELSGDGWRKHTLESLKTFIDVKVNEAGIKDNDRHLLLLRKKLTKCASIKDILLVLEEQLF